MGCGAGRVAVGDTANVPFQQQDQDHNRSEVAKVTPSVGHATGKKTDAPSVVKETTVASEKGNCENYSDSLSNDGEVPTLNRIHTQDMDKSMLTAKADITPSLPRAVAFDVQLQEEVVVSKPLPPLSSYKPPRRLEALHDAPKLTAGELEKKLANAESKRKSLLEKKQKRSKVSKRSNNNRVADESDEKAKKFEERLRSHNEKREKLQSERINKQRKRRQHEESVRERARNMKDENPIDISPENEVETYQSSDDEQEWGDLSTIKNDIANSNGTRQEQTKEGDSPKVNGDTSIDDFYGT